MCDKMGVVCGISTNMTRLSGMTFVGEEAALLLVELRLSMLNVWVKQVAKTNEMMRFKFENLK